MRGALVVTKSLRRFRSEGHCALGQAVDEFGRSRKRADDLAGSGVSVPGG